MKTFPNFRLISLQQNNANVIRKTSISLSAIDNRKSGKSRKLQSNRNMLKLQQKLYAVIYIRVICGI